MSSAKIQDSDNKFLTKYLHTYGFLTLDSTANICYNDNDNLSKDYL